MELFTFPEPNPGIRGKAVPAFFPETGPVHAVIFGEAPGPRGADRSGIPFWGDGAGLPLYRALVRAGCATVPEAAWKPWDGERFIAAGFRPVLCNVALSNAFPSCPTNDGRKFRAPSRAELQGAENLARLETELVRALSRGATRVVTLGRCARDTLGPLCEKMALQLLALPHPSAQGLLSDAPDRGKGARLADLQAAWEERLAQAVGPANAPSA
jgi:uracil-DNA glycosylase